MTQQSSDNDCSFKHTPHIGLNECAPPYCHTKWFARDVNIDKIVYENEEWIDLAEPCDISSRVGDGDLQVVEDGEQEQPVEEVFRDHLNPSVFSDVDKLPTIISPGSSFGDRSSYGPSSPVKFHEDDILRYHSDNSLDSHINYHPVMFTKSSSAPDHIAESELSFEEHPPRKIRENNPEFLKKQFKQVLSIYQFLNKSAASEKKKQIFINLALNVTASNSFDRIGRLMILKNFMLELRDTILDKEHKKNIIINFMDIMIEATIIDQEWYNALKTWLQYDAIPTMDFLYLFRPDDFIPSNLWKWTNK